MIYVVGGRGYFWNNFGGKTLRTLIGIQIFGNARCGIGLKWILGVVN